MKDASTSKVGHVSRKPLQCIRIKPPYVGYAVEVTLRSHYNVYDLFSDTTRLSSSLFSSRENSVIFQHCLHDSIFGFLEVSSTAKVKFGLLEPTSTKQLASCWAGTSQNALQDYYSLRKPKVFALQILRRYLTKEGRVRKFFYYFLLYMDILKRTLRSKI